MYCSNCGKKVDPKAVVCVGCGCSLKKRGNGFGIASMILGLVGLFYALCAFSRVIDLGSYLDYQTILCLYKVFYLLLGSPLVFVIGRIRRLVLIWQDLF